ncbi:hypothetical protein MMC11_007998 [Xylographa trunciseda]|nr:hypothetical protein [Xylographa trunciseda]
MLYFFEKQGYWGLAITMYNFARRECMQAPNSRWKHVLDDYDNHFYDLYALLLTLPGSVIRSLISNTFTSDITHQNKELRNFASTEMAPIDRPGIYFNVIARVQNLLNIPGTGLPSDAGKFLSRNELEPMLDFLGKYLDTSHSADKEARNFDSKFDTGPKQWQSTTKGLQDRRYAPTANSRVILREWEAIIRRLFLTGSPPSDFDVNFDCCLYEVGYSNNLVKRLACHFRNKNTTYLFAFLHSWTKFSMPALSRFGCCHQYTIFPLRKKESHLAAVAEFCGTLLTSSLHTMGGLNCTVPGNVDTDTNAMAYNDPCWGSNFIRTFTRSHVARAIETENELLRHRQKVLSNIPKLQALETEGDKLTQTLQQKEQTLEKLQELRDDLKAQLSKLESDVLQQATDRVRFNPNTNPSNILALTRRLIEIINDLRREKLGQDTTITNWLTNKSITEPNLPNATACNAFRKEISSLRRNHERALDTWSTNFNTSKRSSDRTKRAGSVTLTEFMANMRAAGETALQLQRDQ